MYYIDRTVPFVFAGIDIHDLTAKLNGASASVARLRVPSGAKHPQARSHRCDKFYVLLSGSVSFRVSDDDVTLTPSALLLIEKDEWFSFENREDEPAELLLIHVPPFDLTAEDFATDMSQT